MSEASDQTEPVRSVSRAGQPAAARPSAPESDAGDGAPDAEWQRLRAQTPESDTAVVPPEVVATPDQVRRGPQEELEWWRPGWSTTWQYVGWRWILLIPALGLVLFALVPLRWYNLSILAVGIKLALFMGAVGLTLSGYVVRRAVRARQEPFCIYCGYNLSGLPDHYRCPECGRPYTWRLIAEYRRDPAWFIERYRASRRVPPADVPFDAGPVRRRTRDGT